MYTPYPYQDGCLTVLKTVRIQGKTSALIVMASGLGKTVTVAFDAKEWLKSNKGKILYLCHQNDILDQAQQTFEAVLGRGLSYGFFTGLDKSAHKADCLFASFQTMTRNAERMFAPDEFGYIIVDESHHSQAPSHLKIVEYFKPRFLIGATATPNRADGLNVRTVFGEEVFNLPIERALAQGLLTRVDYRLVTDEISLDQIDQTKIGELTLKDIDHKVFVPKRDEEIAASIDRHSSELSEQKIVVFASSIERAEQLSQSIAGSVTIHSAVPIKERLVRVEMFRQGMVRAVITVDCFNEGVDIPAANMVVFLRSTSSQRIFYQQLGRGLRLCQGKDKVIVLDFVGNAERLAMLKGLTEAIAIHYAEEMATRPNKTPNPFSINFDDKALGVLDLVKKIRVDRISDVPELLAEYSPRNRMSASRVSSRSWKKDAWWTCGKCKFEWQTSPSEKTRGRQCPKCEGQVTAENNLAVLYPKLAKQCSPRNPLPPEQIKAVSKEQVLWICPDCSYEYAARPYSRIYRGDGCPSCADKLREYKSNFAFHSPKLALEYSAENILSPEHVSLRGRHRKYWDCPNCGLCYQACVAERVWGTGSFGIDGCYFCAKKKLAKPAFDFISNHSSLMEEYSSRNPEGVFIARADTDEKLWWICSDCGRYWQASGKERLLGKSCPHCPKLVTVQIEEVSAA